MDACRQAYDFSKFITTTEFPRQNVPGENQVETLYFSSTAKAQAHQIFLRVLPRERQDSDDRGQLFDEAPAAVIALQPVARKYANETTKRWSASVDQADAFFFVTPEYNLFPPASIVNALQIIVAEWAWKSAAVMSYGGVSGGPRSAQILRRLMTSVNLHPIPQTVPVPFLKDAIGEDGKLVSNELVREAVKRALDELLVWAGALKVARSE